jgi:hypothetical protein
MRNVLDSLPPCLHYWNVRTHSVPSHHREITITNFDMPVLLALFLFKKVPFKMQLWQKCISMLHVSVNWFQNQASSSVSWAPGPWASGYSYGPLSLPWVQIQLPAKIICIDSSDPAIFTALNLCLRFQNIHWLILSFIYFCTFSIYNIYNSFAASGPPVIATSCPPVVPAEGPPVVCHQWFATRGLPVVCHRRPSSGSQWHRLLSIYRWSLLSRMLLLHWILLYVLCS